MNERDYLRRRLSDLQARHDALLDLAQSQHDLQEKMLAMIEDLRARQPEPEMLDATVEVLRAAGARLGERWHDANRKRRGNALILAGEARRLRADGMTEEEIAEAIHRSVRTVSTYLNDPRYDG